MVGEEEKEDLHISRKLSTAERREARAAIPATFVDTWSTLRWKGYVRVVLGEYLYRNPHYRMAFLMEMEEAEDFANHLLEMINRQRSEDAGTSDDADSPSPVEEPPQEDLDQNG